MGAPSAPWGALERPRGTLGAMGVHGAPWAPIWPMFPILEKLFPEKLPKIKKCRKCQKWDENIKDARRNSEHFRRIQTFWGPLFDHFPGFNNFVKICQNGPIPQTVQIWPSGQASGLESQDPRGARFDS